MRTLVVCESMYGNTKHVAEAIARGVRAGDDDRVDVVPARIAAECDLSQYDLLVVGAPTHVHGLSTQRTRDAAARAASNAEKGLRVEADASHPGVREWLKTLEPSRGRMAAFDTRLDRSRLLTGRASKTISRRLRHLGYSPVAEPESFVVDDHTRLEAHEAERAEQWGRALRLSAASTSNG